MTRAVIIADDLTGANVTGALLRKNGYRFATFRHGAAVGPGVLSDYDAVAVSTDSRGIEPEAAYSKVKSTAQAFLLPAGCFYQKRIDSTLRGNIGAAIADLAAAYLEAHSREIQALYTSGGDITLGVCEALESAGICVLDEIEPFTMYGELIGGPYSGLPIVTKGGLAGRVDTLRNAMSYLQIKLAEKE